MQSHISIAADCLLLVGLGSLIYRIIVAFIGYHSELQQNNTESENNKLTRAKLQDYQKSVAKSQEHYRDAMTQYDKLMPWAAGGALVLSLSFVASVYRDVPSDSVILLAISWSFLVSSLLSSILSQYFSTRIQVSHQEYLRLKLHEPKNTSKKFAESHRNTLKALAAKILNGNLTKFLNESSAILLIVGLFGLGVFAILALPFGKNLSP